jgi:hypothetical protein
MLQLVGPVHWAHHCHLLLLLLLLLLAASLQAASAVPT